MIQRGLWCLHKHDTQSPKLSHIQIKRMPQYYTFVTAKVANCGSWIKYSELNTQSLGWNEFGFWRFILNHVCRCVHMCVLTYVVCARVCRCPEDRSNLRFWHYRWLWAVLDECWKPNLDSGPQEEQYTHWTSEPLLQTPWLPIFQ